MRFYRNNFCYSHNLSCNIQMQYSKNCNSVSIVQILNWVGITKKRTFPSPSFIMNFTLFSTFIRYSTVNEKMYFVFFLWLIKNITVGFEIPTIYQATVTNLHNKCDIWRPSRKSGLTLKTIEAIKWLHSLRPSP